MLTHVLRRCFYANWAQSWLKHQLPKRPSSVSVNDVGDLVLECSGDVQEQETVWAPDYIVKRLRQSKDKSSAVRCCWHLCRQYDDGQETAKVVTAALARRLKTKIGFAAWYWDDQHGTLVAEAPAKGDPQSTADVKTKQIDADVTSFALLPCTWLMTTLVDHIEQRAFPRQDNK